MLIRRAADALSLNARIDGFGKCPVFDKPRRFAGIICEPLALSGRLYPAVIHLKNYTLLRILNDALRIYVGIKTKA